jgi:hypothetical protein
MQVRRVYASSGDYLGTAFATFVKRPEDLLSQDLNP